MSGSLLAIKKIAFFSSLLLFCTICRASDGPDLQKVRECFRYLQKAGELQKVQPFIPWEALNITERDILNWIGNLNGKIFVKSHWSHHIPGDGFYEVVRFSQELSDAGVGPKFYGTTLDYADSWALVYEFIDGSDYMPKYDWAEENMNKPTWQTILPNKEISQGVIVNETTIRDVNRAFDVLISLKIEAEDVEFMLTHSGRAYLVDYGAFRRGKTLASVRKHNEKIRAAMGFLP
jgi:hypothetical protein